MYLDCPPGMDFHCPGAKELAAAHAAIAAGHITWEAYPHDAQLEMMSPALIKAGLLHTFALDARAGQHRKRTLSQRDVPGTTRGVIPVLRSMGVTTIAIGQNSGSPVPETGSTGGCFVWRDPPSNTSLFYLHVEGYGWWGGGHGCEGYGMKHGLVFNFNGDNSGPSTAAEYGLVWKNLGIT